MAEAPPEKKPLDLRAFKREIEAVADQYIVLTDGHPLYGEVTLVFKGGLLQPVIRRVDTMK